MVAVCDVVSRRLVATRVDLCHPWLLDAILELEISCLLSCGDDLLFVQLVRHLELTRSCFAFLAGHRHSRFTTT
ncbi:hypothetical protein E2562_032879 [Oryza meyeriana var. granulata]|uniref:Uncharacterized protein n=1 Tax=Oryza meyeriana var. granulata TaxID=110450 RepID=A0A6G1F0T1_9ORYZ|nr:hypothetical protein E2562_032879 [Oryza meyeriana var. granulata]